MNVLWFPFKKIFKIDFVRVSSVLVNPHLQIFKEPD